MQNLASRLGDKQPVVIRAGSGEFLIRAALERLEWTSPSISLAEELGPTLSAAAPAHAVAVLAAENHS
jgi:(4-(4-[2-(gamma-L-glutamylamino)ethyl]phenoxymethyl)furan-2-yl)methanamine synthase